MARLGYSDEIRYNEVMEVLRRMMAADAKLYDTLTETLGFAYHFNVLALLAQRREWTLAEVEQYLRDGKNPYRGRKQR